MVMPQLVLYDRQFYREHYQEIDKAAAQWGYARCPEVDGMIAFERNDVT